MATGSGLRIGDADREAAAAGLREHYATGRLTLDEFQERLDAVFAAKTDSDLARISSDLPHAPFTAPWPPSGTGGASGGTLRPVRRRALRSLSGVVTIAVALVFLATAVAIAGSFRAVSFLGIFTLRPLFFLLAALVLGRRLLRRSARGRPPGRTRHRRRF